MAADGFVVHRGEVAQVADDVRPAVHELVFEQGDGVGVVVPQETHDGFVLLKHRWNERVPLIRCHRQKSKDGARCQAKTGGVSI